AKFSEGLRAKASDVGRVLSSAKDIKDVYDHLQDHNDLVKVAGFLVQGIPVTSTPDGFQMHVADSTIHISEPHLRVQLARLVNLGGVIFQERVKQVPGVVPRQ